MEDTFNIKSNPELNVMDLLSRGKTINPVGSQLTLATLRIDGNKNKNKSIRLNKNNKTCKTVNKIVADQLINDSNSITVKSKKRKREEITISGGAMDLSPEGR